MNDGDKRNNLYLSSSQVGCALTPLSWVSMMTVFQKTN